jgi:hypothetical protein
MLDEKELRKPTFSEGHTVTLADGQKWTFPKPRIRLVPKIVDGKVEIGGGATFGPEYDDRLDALFGTREVDPTERLRLQFEVAVRLLQSNYDLRDEDVSQLIVLELGDQASDERWEQLTDVLLGNAPKPSPAT